jgi:hypothetical protein
LGSWQRPRIGRRTLVACIIVPLACLVAIILFAHSHRPTTFCADRGSGATPTAAIEAYLHRCGRRYTLAAGPFDALKSTSAYASYADLVEYRLNVLDNGEGPVAFMLIGKPTAAAPWRTLGRPGTGP